MDEQQALLEQLHDLQAPEVSHVPALGWWVLAAVLCGFVYALWRYRKNHQQRLWYRQAISEIHSIRDNPDQQSLQTRLMRCSVLARKLALVGLPRSESAAIVGDNWLQQLDTICGEPVFNDKAGKLLTQAPYQASPNIAPNDIIALSTALEQLAAAVLRGPKKA